MLSENKKKGFTSQSNDQNPYLRYRNFPIVYYIKSSTNAIVEIRGYSFITLLIYKNNVRILQLQNRQTRSFIDWKRYWKQIAEYSI